MDKKPDTIVGRKVYYPGPHGMMVLDGKGPPKRISGALHLAELPPGDWVMTLHKERVILADRSGQSKPIMVDKEGNWQTLEHSDVKPLVFEQSRVFIGGEHGDEDNSK